MKKVILGAFLLTGVVTFAQEKTAKTTTTNRTVTTEQLVQPVANNKEATTVTVEAPEAHDHAKQVPSADTSKNSTTLKTTENKAAVKTTTITTKNEKATQPKTNTTK